MLKDIERMRVEIPKPQVLAPLILQPMILNRHNTGSSGNCRETGSLTPTPAPTWCETPNKRPHVIHDPKETFIAPNNKDPNNFVNNKTFNTNSMELDEGLSHGTSTVKEDDLKRTGNNPTNTRTIPRKP